MSELQQLELQAKERRRILLLCSGSVATVKIPELAVELLQFADLRIICSSEAAFHFLCRAEEYNPVRLAKK